MMRLVKAGLDLRQQSSVLNISMLVLSISLRWFVCASVFPFAEGEGLGYTQRWQKDGTVVLAA
jgi:hypothetical protein